MGNIPEWGNTALEERSYLRIFETVSRMPLERNVPAGRGKKANRPTSTFKTWTAYAVPTGTYVLATDLVVFPSSVPREAEPAQNGRMRRRQNDRTQHIGTNQLAD